MMYGIRADKNGYTIREPKDDISRRSYGFVMVCNPKGEVLKFFSESHIHEARKYFDYVSLTRYEKLKYWLNYKRGQ